MIYVGSFTLPFAHSSYVVKFQCPEYGTTGIRDSVVAAQKLEFDPESGEPIGWFQDPYDPDFTASVLRNRSDDTEWDRAFPDHPLSRLRRYLDLVSSQMEVDAELRTQEPFRTTS